MLAVIEGMVTHDQYITAHPYRHIIVVSCSARLAECHLGLRNHISSIFYKQMFNKSLTATMDPAKG